MYILIPPPVFEKGNKVLYQIRKETIENEIIPAVRRIAEMKKVGCVDMYGVFKDRKELFADGVHPNAQGSKVFAEKIYEVIKDRNI